jgi:hypothetical protein
MERRSLNRKKTQALSATQIINCESLKKLFKVGYIIDTSLNGFLLSVDRKDVIQEDLKSSLSLDSLIGTPVSLFISEMELELDGKIKVTRHIGKGLFEVFVHFSPETPKYWRECLMDLMPQPGELED